MSFFLKAVFCRESQIPVQIIVYRSLGNGVAERSVLFARFPSSMKMDEVFLKAMTEIEEDKRDKAKLYLSPPDKTPYTRVEFDAMKGKMLKEMDRHSGTVHLMINGGL